MDTNHSEMALETLVDSAGDAASLPKDPGCGIAKQWLPGFIRWPLRVLFLPFVLLDGLAQYVAKKIIKPPFIQSGSCKRRGNCCHYILLPEAKGLLGRIGMFWSTQVYGFFLRDKQLYAQGKDKVYVMGCRYLDKTGKCRHYFLRPSVCRRWPVIEVFGRPRILKGCGFTALPRKEYFAKKGFSIPKDEQ